jgi:hypothetical protein
VGLTRLSSDEIASLDALVRRDIASRITTNAEPAPGTTFSQRLSADERRVTGVASLTENEVAKLNALVDAHAAARLARTLLAPPVFLARKSRIQPEETKTQPEIHGSFTLAYSWGSGGYSAKTGAMVLSFEDPKRRFSISVGYSETHVKYDDGADGEYIRRGPPDAFEREPLLAPR